MKKTLALIFCSAIISGQAAAQPYGRQYYPSSSALTSGYRVEAPGNEGFLMAGLTGINGQEIHIDKTFQGGAMPSTSGPTSFQKEYSLSSTGLTCLGLPAGTLLPPQGGVCAIEATGAGYNYVMANNFTEGVAVTFLDNSGSVVNTLGFRFPGTSSGFLVRPTIVHQPSGEIFVCGAFNSNLYVFKIDNTGALAWGNLYFITGVTQSSFGVQPMDMTVSNPTGEVVVVGSVMPGAFFLKLDPNTGTVNLFNTYGPNGDCHFTKIRNTQNGNFLIGGLYNNSMNIPAGNPIMLTLDQMGNPIWNTRLITGVPGQNSFGEIRGIAERFNPFTAQFEYYGVTETNNNGCTVYGMSVFKLDAAGNPVPGINEFHYPNDGYSTVVNLSINEWGPNDVGFHIYANGSAASVSGNLVHTSYYNGVSASGSCSEFLTSCNWGVGPNQMVHNIMLRPAISQCNDVVTSEVINGSTASICLSPSIGGGSNFKMTSVEEQKANIKGIAVHPNPGAGMYTIELDYDADVVVFDMLGKTVLQTSVTRGSNKLNLLAQPAGVYNVRISGATKTETIQLIKE